MLSILIPTYNYDITPLVKEMHKQCKACHIKFEILVYDDASKSHLNSTNTNINDLDFCTFKELPNNMGRSAIRNLLAKNAQYSSLLFIDAGTFPKHDNFIEKYLSIKNKSAVSGGMTHLETPPRKPYKLRWLYTKKREFKTLCSSNFMINKDIFLSNCFDETIKKYGYEDVLFFEKLSQKNIQTHIFNNPVIHSADDDANTFIKKTEFAIENLIDLIETKKIDADSQKMYRLYSGLKRLKLVFLTHKFHEILKPFLLKNFNSSYASIILFDVYRIGYFCYLKTK
tara:strand:- start:1119 stop:1970 length:852 start_codon:yes stop_codon:yes gene_type:complete